MRKKAGILKETERKLFSIRYTRERKKTTAFRHVKNR